MLVAPALDEADRIGEFLSSSANALLRELGVAESFAAGPHRPAHATYAAWGTALLAQRHSIGLPDGPGHVLDRMAFLRMLRQAAARSSVTEIGDTVIGDTVAGRRQRVWRLVASARRRRVSHIPFRPGLQRARGGCGAKSRGRSTGVIVSSRRAPFFSNRPDRGPDAGNHDRGSPVRLVVRKPCFPISEWPRLSSETLIHFPKIFQAIPPLFPKRSRRRKT